MRTEFQAKAAWERANWPAPQWGWASLSIEEQWAWIAGDDEEGDDQ